MEEQAKNEFLGEQLQDMRHKQRQKDELEDKDASDEDDGSSTCSSTNTVNKSDDGLA